jgi:hypothetical protein
MYLNSSANIHIFSLYGVRVLIITQHTLFIINEIRFFDSLRILSRKHLLYEYYVWERACVKLPERENNN